MKNTKFTGKASAFAAAAVIAASAFAGCAASSGSTTALDANMEYAQANVKEFATSEPRLTLKFADAAFSKANIVALSITAKSSDEDLEKMARFLSADSIALADETGKIVACYPADDKGKTLKETEDKRIFNRIVSGDSFKSMTDPVQVEGSDEYSLYAGVPGAEGKGAAIVSFKTSDYARVIGADLADVSGNNIAVLRDDVVISSTLPGVEVGKKLDELSFKKEDIDKGEFTAKLSESEFVCKAQKSNGFTVVCGQK